MLLLSVGFCSLEGRCAAVNTPKSHVICGRPADRALSHSVVNSEWGVRVKGFALFQFFMFVRGGSRAYTSKHVAGKEREKKKNIFQTIPRRVYIKVSH